MGFTFGQLLRMLLRDIYQTGGPAASLRLGIESNVNIIIYYSKTTGRLSINPNLRLQEWFLFIFIAPLPVCKLQFNLNLFGNYALDPPVVGPGTCGVSGQMDYRNDL